MPSKQEALDALAATDAEGNAQEARGLAIIAQRDAQIVAKDTHIAELDALIAELNARPEVPDDVAASIEALKANLQNNFVAAEPPAEG